MKKIKSWFVNLPYEKKKKVFTITIVASIVLYLAIFISEVFILFWGVALAAVLLERKIIKGEEKARKEARGEGEAGKTPNIEDAKASEAVKTPKEAHGDGKTGQAPNIYAAKASEAAKAPEAVEVNETVKAPEVNYRTNTGTERKTWASDIDLQKVCDEFEALGWNLWDSSIHYAEGQDVRVKRGITEGHSLIWYNQRTGHAKVKSVHGHYYLVSGERCSCPDFRKKGLPCKHMYFLASCLPNYGDHLVTDLVRKPPAESESLLLYGLQFCICGRNQAPIKEFLTIHGSEFGTYSNFDTTAVIVTDSTVSTTTVSMAESQNTAVIPFDELKDMVCFEQEVTTAQAEKKEASADEIATTPTEKTSAESAVASAAPEPLLEMAIKTEEIKREPVVELSRLPNIGTQNGELGCFLNYKPFPIYPPSEKQYAYLKDLGVIIPEGITNIDASCMLSRALEEDSLNSPNQTMVKLAVGLGVRFSAYIGEDGLLDTILGSSGERTRTALYVYSVAQNLRGKPFGNMLEDPALEKYFTIADAILADSNLLRSLNDRTPDDFLKPYRGTAVYKAVAALLQEKEKARESISNKSWTLNMDPKKVGAEFESLGWDNWDPSIHQIEGQSARVNRGLAEGHNLIWYNSRTGYAKVKSAHEGYYLVNKARCSCSDFRNRGIPCKHMYFLASCLPNYGDYLATNPVLESPEEPENLLLHGLQFSICGRNQAPIKEFLAIHGSEFGTYSNSDTTAVIVTESTVSTSSVSMAESQNTAVITFDELKDMICFEP